MLLWRFPERSRAPAALPVTPRYGYMAGSALLRDVRSCRQPPPTFAACSKEKNVGLFIVLSVAFTRG